MPNSTFNPTETNVSYTRTPYISALVAQQELERLFGRPVVKRQRRVKHVDNTKYPFIYTLAVMTGYCGIFWLAVAKIIFS